jgi:hypothetical protein
MPQVPNTATTRGTRRPNHGGNQMEMKENKLSTDYVRICPDAGLRLAFDPAPTGN